MEYKIVRSSRKTISIYVRPDRTVEVRAPWRVSSAEIAGIVESKKKWIEKHLRMLEEPQPDPSLDENAPAKLSMEEIRGLAEQALTVIPERVRHYAPLVGVKYGRITIRNQRSRWGSCSAKGNLNFNCLLMLTPPEVIDSVVVHELCHRLEMNHSGRFYREVLRVFPDYHKWNKWLKANGPRIMARMV